MNKLLIVTLIALLAACGPAATTQPPTLQPAPSVTATHTPLPPTVSPTASPSLTPLPSATATPDPNGVRVTFVGNAGFLVQVGEKKILIDAIFEGFSEYEQPQAVKDLLFEALPPFDGVDLILATHGHADHFSAEQIQHYLEISPETVFISTAEAAGQISGLGERVIPISLAEGETVLYEMDGMTVEAFYLSHGRLPSGESYPNLGFLVTVGDTRVFHTGDLDVTTVRLADLQAYGLPEREITLAFVPHFLMRAVSYVQLALQGFNARYYFPIHYAYTNPAFNADLIARQMPEAVVFEEELDTWVMP
jgi:L-ascorbate metabolism protein UlaG (beta-lactamase superfamily)